MNNDTNDINTRITNLEEKMEIILNKLDKLDKLDNIEDNCVKMGNHISFVESVYETVRAPLQYISNKLSTTPTALPSSNIKELEN